MQNTKNQLIELVLLLNSASEEIQQVINDLDSDELNEVEKKHKVGNLMLKLDLALINNRKRFDQILKSMKRTRESN
jgi:hypothetical protein